MSNIVDDLLQEVEQLESSTQELNSNLQKAEAQKDQLNSAEESSILDANLIALEAAKTAQEASVQSHLAAKSSIKLVEQLKSQVLERDEFNFNWRQSIRNTSKDLQSAKNSFSMMMIGTLVINITALSVMGYFFYNMNKESAAFKAEVLDVIKIEDTLLSKKVTLKVDELSSLIEYLSADISRLMKNSDANGNRTHAMADSAQAPLPPTQTTALKPEVTPEVIVDQEHRNTHATALETAATEMPVAPAHVSTMDSSEVANTVIAAISEKLASLQPTASTPFEATADYAALKRLIETILAEQHKLQASASRAKQTVSSTLDPSQLKLLTDIKALISQQATTLKAIQTKLLTVSKASTAQKESQTQDALKALKIELNALNQQQAGIQQQVKELNQAFTDYAAQPKTLPAYRYQTR